MERILIGLITMKLKLTIWAKDKKDMIKRMKEVEDKILEGHNLGGQWMLIKEPFYKYKPGKRGGYSC